MLGLTSHIGTVPVNQSYQEKRRDFLLLILMVNKTESKCEASGQNSLTCVASSKKRKERERERKREMKKNKWIRAVMDSGAKKTLNESSPPPLLQTPTRVPSVQKGKGEGGGDQSVVSQSFWEKREENRKPQKQIYCGQLFIVVVIHPWDFLVLPWEKRAQMQTDRQNKNKKVLPSLFFSTLLLLFCRNYVFIIVLMSFL
jgi:hypothetical protein